MRKYLLFPLAALLLAAAGTILFAWQGAPRKGQDVQRIMVIAGNRALTSAGVTLGPNDSVTVTGGGRVYFSAGKAQSGTGPAGWARGSYAPDWPEDCNACDDPIMDAGHAALIAEVNGEKFYVGPNSTFSGKEGLLYFGINDCTFAGEFHNTGQFNITFTVRRNAVPHR